MTTVIQPQNHDVSLPVDRVSVNSTTHQVNTTQNPANTAQMIDKLYNQNLNLSREIGLLSSQLPALLEKGTTTKSKKNLSNSNVVSSGHESTLQKELNETYKQINHHQKELKTLQAKYDSSANNDRYREVENQIAVKEKELNKVTAEKNTVEKLVAEKEKAIDTIRKQTGIDVKVTMLGDELKDLKERLKTVQTEEKKLEAEADKDNAQIAKLKEELSKVKEAYRYMIEKTNYDTREDKVRPKPVANPLNKKESKDKSKPEKVTKSEKQVELEKLPFNPANFQKIYAEVKELRKTEANKEKGYKKESDGLKEKLETLKKEGEDMAKKLADKEKEANILTIKLRELHRIARYHSILPVDDDEAGKAPLKINVQSKVASYLSPTSNSTSKINSPASITFPTKPKLGRIESLNEYAKNNFLYNGYRKDDRGKISQDGSGEHFSDKDLMGTTKPKIVGLKVWHDNRRITGFQAVYKTPSGLKEGTAHVKNPQAYKLESFEMGGEDYLKEISGFTNKADNNFECLMLMSAKGETKKILEPNRESKLFKFDINELEFPSIIYGYLKEETPRNYVTKFGILIASDNIEEKIQIEKHGESPSKSR